MVDVAAVLVLESHDAVVGFCDVVRTLVVVVDVKPDVVSVPLVKVLFEAPVDTVEVSKELVEKVCRESLIETVVDPVPSEPVVRTLVVRGKLVDKVQADAVSLTLEVVEDILVVQGLVVVDVEVSCSELMQDDTSTSEGGTEIHNPSAAESCNL